MVDDEIRTIGNRQEPTISAEPRPPSDAEQAWVRSMAENRRLIVPKGIFRYVSHEEANRDWEAWMAETMACHDQAMHHE